jgi:hypothetical protein
MTPCLPDDILNFMKKLLIDASSAILLYKAGLFDRLANTYDVLMANAVHQELTLPGYPGAERFQQHFKSQGKNTAIEKHPSRKTGNIKTLDHLDQGEKDTIREYLNGHSDFIMIDDYRGAVWCRDNDIPYINALLFPRLLHLSNCVTESEFRYMKDKLLSLGRYSGKIIEYALKCPSDYLSFFMP